MKKFILLFTIIFGFILCNSLFVYGASNQETEDANFYITSGLDFSQEPKSTFDQTLTITGKAQKGNTVTITVYQKLLEKEEDLKEINKYEIAVGASGYFSKSISLAIGENIVEISVVDEDKNKTSISTSITRKKSQIKSELEQATIISRVRR